MRDDETRAALVGMMDGGVCACSGTAGCYFCFGTGILLAVVGANIPCPICEPHPGLCVR